MRNLLEKSKQRVSERQFPSNFKEMESRRSLQKGNRESERERERERERGKTDTETELK
jgi:hypothetical protein